jgi:hypothetical protein
MNKAEKPRERLRKDQVTGDWRKLHNEELRDLYSSPSIIRIIKSRRMRWADHVARMAEKLNAYGVLVREPKGKRPLTRPRRKRKLILERTRWYSLNRGYCKAVVSTVMNLAVNTNFEKNYLVALYGLPISKKGSAPWR